ncbi:MAG: FAD-dependent oxidoreductase [Gammaproteobacteria bacterium]
MHRNLPELARTEYDLVIIGGGAAGAAAAREAALRGLKVALVERHDFGSGTSAHCFKVVHGGIRYLRQGDIRRLRSTSYERSVFLRLAPHLVKPLPFVVPTYGMGKRSRWFLGAGMLAYDVLSADRNLQITDPSRRVHATRFFGREQTLAMFPTIPEDGLTGAVSFEDGLMHNPARLVLSFIMAATQLGAHVANYVEAERLLVRDKRVHGVAVRDVLTGDRFDIRARVVLNAAGPWAEGLLKGLTTRNAIAPSNWSRDACFVINRRPGGPWALALPGVRHDGDATPARGARHLFMVPWRDRTLVGGWHSIVPRDADAARVTRGELRAWIDEINASHPGFELRESEVERVDFGLVPFGDAPGEGPETVGGGKRSRLIDHRSSDGISGLITSITARFTGARLDAANALGCVMKQIYRKDLDPFNPASVASAVANPERGARSRSVLDPLPGGEFDDYERLLAHSRRNRPLWMSPASIESLAANYGTHMHRVVAMADADPSLRRCVAGTHVTLAEVAYALRDEMVHTLGDIIFRRTELGTGGHPGEAALAEVSMFMQQALGWSARHVADERRQVDAQLERHLTALEPTRQATHARAPGREAEADLLTNAV